MASRLTRMVRDAVHRRGFVITRHPAIRRQALFAAQGVDVVFDVGAAVGSFGRELRHFGYDGRIVSFEPMGAPYGELEAAAAGDPDWITHRCALGRDAGRATINVASNSDSSSLLPMAAEHRKAAPQIDYVATEEIEIARLDDLADQHLDDADTGYLKIDTQGFEKDVLAGAEKTLSRCVGLQLELSFVPLYEGGPLIDEMISLVYDLGFRMAAVDPGFAAPHGPMLQADGVFFRQSLVV